MPGVQGGASAHAGWTVVRHECSSHRFLDSSYLHLYLSQLHSTARPSPEHYDNRYEVEGRTNFLELRACELMRMPLPRTWVNTPSRTPWHPFATAGGRKDHAFRGCDNSHNPLRCPCGRGVRPPYTHTRSLRPYES